MARIDLGRVSAIYSEARREFDRNPNSHWPQRAGQLCDLIFWLADELERSRDGVAHKQLKLFGGDK